MRTINVPALDTDASGDFEFAVTGRLRHGALWQQVKQFGSQAALARHLDMSLQELNGIVNLRKKPSKKIMEKLVALTGQSAGQLFPEMFTPDFLDIPKEFEGKKRLSLKAVEKLCSGDVRPLLLEGPVMVSQLLKLLSHREREILKMRFGIDGGEPMTLKAIGKIYQRNQETIRTIIHRAVCKLRHPLEQGSKKVVAAMRQEYEDAAND